MKPFVLSLAVALMAGHALLAQSAAPVAAPATAPLQPGDLVAVCGDSITEQRIYSVFIEDYLLMCAPQAGLKTVQFGWGGEQAGGFKGRMKTDALTFSPTVATTCYGMNDGGYREFEERTGEAYAKNMTAIVQTFKEGGVRTIIVGSPGVVDSTAYKRPQVTPEVYNEALRRLGEEGKKVAEAEGVLFADLHSVFMETMAKAKAAHGDDYAVAGGDGVHPGANGHLIMAYAFLKAMGLDGAIATITLDAKTGKATATEGTTVTASQPGEIRLESTRYPFCLIGKPGGVSPHETTEIARFFPFNADLNRYTLVVKGLAAPKAKVTWSNAASAASREFTAEELAAGVNLAEAFAGETPFQSAFMAVDKLVRDKQFFETTFVKTILAPGGIRAILADDTTDYDDISAKFRAIHTKMLKSVGTAKKPVAHTIAIEEVK